MATDNPIHNGIQYFGIATYENVNDETGDTIFIDYEESIKRCLSKQVADEHTDDFTYKDDDPNGGKLLKYSSLEFFSNIPIFIQTSKDSYYLDLYSCSIIFSQTSGNIPEKRYTLSFAENTEFDGGDLKDFDVRNDRIRMTIPNSFNSGIIKLTIVIAGQITNDFGRPVTGAAVRCGFSYYRNNVFSEEVMPMVFTQSGGGGMFTYSCEFELSWVSDNLGTDNITYLKPDLDKVWPYDAEKFMIQIYAGG